MILFKFRKNELISNSQQTDITNNITDTNTQTTITLMNII